MSRNLRIDTLRGFACVLLVAFHVVGAEGHGLKLQSDHLLSQTSAVLIYLRMPLFSVLSGFVYAWRPYKDDPLHFMKGKARRLLIPMLLVGTFFAMLQSITPGVNSNEYNWALLHIIPVAHFWFLESLFIVFMATAGLEHLKLLSTPARFAAIWIAALLMFMFTSPPEYFGLGGAVYLLPFFLLGIACNRFSNFLERLSLIGLASALLAVTALVVYTDQPLPGSNSLTAILLGASACVVLLRSGIQIPWLAWIGYFSFAIYLFHTMFSAASRILLTYAGVESVALLFTAGLFFGMLGPIAASAVLRKIPFGYLALGEQGKRKTGGKTVPGEPTATTTTIKAGLR